MWLGQDGVSRPATWRMSDESADSCTLRANSHCCTRPDSSSARPAIRAASPAGSTASLSSQLSMCCTTSYAGSPTYGLGSMTSHGSRRAARMLPACRSVHSSTCRAAVSGSERNSAIPSRASPGSIRCAGSVTVYLASNSSAHASHICASGRNGYARCACVHSRRSSPATTMSCSGSGSTWPSCVPGTHRSISSMYADSLAQAACSRTVPFPSQIRNPAASSRSSPPGNRCPTLSTSPPPAGPVTGATQEHWPPGWNGSPTDSDHRRARPDTIPGRVAIQSRTPGSRAAVSARYLGTGNAAMTASLPGASSRVNRSQSGLGIAHPGGNVGGARYRGRMLGSFHPAVRTWFERRFPAGPTEPQAAGWPTIAGGGHALIAAPTGSGKTLAAFLVCIDRLYRAPEPGSGPSVVYVSPLKALAVDIQQNLEAPLREIAAVAASMGLEAPDIRVAVRTGDTAAAERAAMLKRPPDFLITTPESLYLLVTAERSRAMLRNVRTIIVDEIHAVAGNKRGSHLSLTLERVAHITQEKVQRVGLSATQRPIDAIARLLVGAGEECAVVDTGHRRELDLALELPDDELGAVASASQMAQILDLITAHVQEHTTTLVFVNTRRMAERIAHELGDRLGEELGAKVAAHHGSLSRDRRLRVERRLRSGDLRALVATASLELGIDIGPVELVCQIGSPRSFATFLQRVGRSNHTRTGTPAGRLYPTARDELVECAALLRGVRAGRLDAIVIPVAPLDILAQQLVAECAATPWSADELFDLVRRAAPYSGVSRADFDDVVEMLAEGIRPGRGRRDYYMHRDQVNGPLKARRGARLAALTSGGAIPELGDFRVVAEPDEVFVGTVNEDWAIESSV